MNKFQKTNKGKEKKMKTRTFLSVLALLVILTACAPQVVASTQVLAEQFDYCAITPSSDLVDQSSAGTPIPPEATKILTQGNLEQVQSMDFRIVGENFSKDRIAVVFIPVGFEDGTKEGLILELTNSINKNFENTKLNFGYVDRSIPIGINLLEYSSNFVNWDEYFAIKERIDSRVDHAIIVFVINSNKGFASASEYKIIISASTPDIELVLTHEMGHIFGLDDGYPSYRSQEELPNTELWFADNKSDVLTEAISEAGGNPPVFQVGSCNGKSVYSFYDPHYNIMWSEMHQSGQPWGSIFTPIQEAIIDRNVEKMLNP